jgi:hypothetical protein
MRMTFVTQGAWMILGTARYAVDRLLYADARPPFSAKFLEADGARMKTFSFHFRGDRRTGQVLGTKSAARPQTYDRSRYGQQCHHGYIYAPTPRA